MDGISVRTALVAAALLVVASASIGAARPTEAEARVACADALPEASTQFQGCVLDLYLERLDAELIATYAATLKRLSESGEMVARKRLVEAERAWIAYRDKTCAYENELGGTNGIGSISCFVRYTEERILYLANQ